MQYRLSQISKPGWLRVTICDTVGARSTMRWRYLRSRFDVTRKAEFGGGSCGESKGFINRPNTKLPSDTESGRKG